MNIFHNRYLVCTSASFLAFFVFSAYCDHSLRSILVIICLLLLSFCAALLFVVKRPTAIRLSKLKRLLLACILCACIAVAAPLFMFNFKNGYANRLDNQCARIRAVVTEINVEENQYASFNARVIEANDQKTDFTILIFSEFSPQISVGDIFVCSANLSSDFTDSYYSEIMLRRQNILYNTRLSDQDNFSIIDSRHSIVSIITKLGDKLGYKFNRTFSKNTSALAKALLLGDRHGLSPLLTRDFGRSGISHLLALSGMHLALIIGFVTNLLKPFILNPKLRFILTSLLAVFIIIFTGASSSILRAALMLIYYQAGNLIRNRSDILTSLFAVTTLIIIFDPYAVFDAGLMLSFSATLGIALILPVIHALEMKMFDPTGEQSIPIIVLRLCFESLCVSFAAGIFATVASYFIFDRISLLSPVTTLIFTPLIVLLMISASLAVAVSLFSSTTVIIGITELVSDTIYSLSSRISEFDNIMVSTNNPIMTAFVIALVLSFLICIICNTTHSRFWIVILICHIVFVSSFAVHTLTYSKTRVHMTAYEKDCGIFVSDGRRSAYIDMSGGPAMTGTISAAVYEHMDTNLDLYVLTHYHFDHIAAIRDFNDYIPICKILMPIPENDTDRRYAADIEALAKRTKIEYEYYNSYTEFDINGIKAYALPLERKNKSSHPYTAISLEKGEFKTVLSTGYDLSSENFGALREMMSDADTVICSTHSKSPIRLAQYAHGTDTVLVFGQTDTAVKYDNELVLPYCICEIAEFE